MPDGAGEMIVGLRDQVDGAGGVQADDGDGQPLCRAACEGDPPAQTALEGDVLRQALLKGEGAAGRGRHDRRGERVQQQSQLIRRADEEGRAHGRQQRLILLCGDGGGGVLLGMAHDDRDVERGQQHAPQQRQQRGLDDAPPKGKLFLHENLRI